MPSVMAWSLLVYIQLKTLLTQLTSPLIIRHTIILTKQAYYNTKILLSLNAYLITQAFMNAMTYLALVTTPTKR